MKTLSHSHTQTLTHMLSHYAAPPMALLKKMKTHQCLPCCGELWHIYPCCLRRSSLPSSTKSRRAVEPHVFLPVSFNCIFEVTATVKQWHRMVKMKATAQSLGPSQVLDGSRCGVLNSLWVGVADPSHRGAWCPFVPHLPLFLCCCSPGGQHPLLSLPIFQQVNKQ